MLEIKKPGHQPWYDVFLGKDANQCRGLISQDKSLRLLLRLGVGIAVLVGEGEDEYYSLGAGKGGLLFRNLLQAHHQEVHPDPLPRFL